MTKARTRRDGSDDGDLLAVFGFIAAGDQPQVARLLEASPDLAASTIRVGASRHDPDTYFLVPIRHHVYAGDTALHIAAAAYQRDIAESLSTRGADVRARNRRGAEPLHYAADGSPDAERWDPQAQQDVIAHLIRAGADVDALDKSGIAPLHRAVRTRCSAAVGTLIDHGADPMLMNKRGSTPLHLAVQNTGRTDSGSGRAKEEQARIIALLLENGARPTDVDAHGKSVSAAASSDWIRELLDTL